MLKNLPYEPLVKLVTRPLYFHALTITITTLKGQIIILIKHGTQQCSNIYIMNLCLNW